jgi:hypothetical protein
VKILTEPPAVGDRSDFKKSAKMKFLAGKAANMSIGKA